MIVNKEEVLRVMVEHQAQEMTFRFYSVLATEGGQPTDLTSYESLVPAGQLIATYEHRPDIKVNPLEVIRSEWESIAYFKLDGEVICKRSAYGQPMISRQDDLFTQRPYKLMIEKELQAEKSGREIAVSDLTEKDAGNIMSDYAR